MALHTPLAHSGPNVHCARVEHGEHGLEPPLHFVVPAGHPTFPPSGSGLQRPAEHLLLAQSASTRQVLWSGQGASHTPPQSVPASAAALIPSEQDSARHLPSAPQLPLLQSVPRVHSEPALQGAGQGPPQSTPASWASPCQFRTPSPQVACAHLSTSKSHNPLPGMQSASRVHSAFSVVNCSIAPAAALPAASTTAPGASRSE